MEKRTQAILTLVLFAGHSLYMIAYLMQLEEALRVPNGLVSLISYCACLVGLQLLWSTGLFRYSPLRRFYMAGIGLYIFSILLRILHWPYSEVCFVMSLLGLMAVYAVHFFFKATKAMRDILRLLVVLISITMVGLMQLHLLDRSFAYWAASGIIAIAALEFWLNPVVISLPVDEPQPVAKMAEKQKDSQDLKQDHPDLFQ